MPCIITEKSNDSATARRKKGSAYAAAYLAESYLGIGKVAEAESLLNDAISACGALSDRRGMSLCHFYFGHLEQRRGNLVAALGQYLP